MRGFQPDAPAFATVFWAEAALFIAADLMALHIMDKQRRPEAALVPGD